MFDIGWSELAVIALVAVLVIGPKDLPKAMRTAALWIRKIRALANEFQSGLNEIVREAELDELKRDIDRATSVDLKNEIGKHIDPTGEAERALDLGGDLHSLDKPAETAEATATTDAAGTAEPAPAAEAPAADERPKEPAPAGDTGSDQAAKP
ncbi:MAG: Sec-independent protein translocase protein TatB [Candidatus Eiseniibacteriota bacterium]